MFYPFLDIVVRRYQLRNGAERTYTLPYNAEISIGDFRPDDSGGGTVSVEHFRRVQDSGVVKQFILDTRVQGQFNTDEMSCGSVIALAGDTLRVDANDDFDVRVYIKRLSSDIPETTIS